MKQTNHQKQVQKKVTEIKTFPVPFPLAEMTKNISLTTNASTQFSKEEIINEAFKYHSQGKISEAIKYYQYFINQGFIDHRVFSNYGNILKDLGNLKEAELSTRKAIGLNPNFAEAYSTLGSILIEIDNLKEAEICIRKAIQLNPNLAEAYLSLGTIFFEIGKLQKAKEATHKAIELNPHFADAYVNLSFIELLEGNYQSGLKNYEFRFKKKIPTIPHCTTKLKRLDDQQLEIGEKLLVVSEQGLGDTLQYMRYIPYLRNLGVDVAFCAQSKLHSLIRSSGIDSHPFTPEETNKVAKGKWIPLLSLPRLLKVNPENTLISQPYIKSSNELNQKWKKILSKEKKIIIGINWQGNPNMENTYQGRSIPLEIFSTLAQYDEIKILSLQKGFGSEQLNHCSFKNKFVKCQQKINSIWDFLENAAIIENCDLIITCDTSIAHLAGGMGKKVWLLLKDIPYWTWGLKKSSTFWYPSMKLFRQKDRRNWQEVMNRVSTQLNTEIVELSTTQN